MKYFYIFCIFLIHGFLFGQEFNGKYWGEIKNSQTLNGSMYYFETIYSFSENTYLLDIDCSGNFNAFNIPEKYITEESGLRKYYERGTFSLKNEKGFSYIYFANSNPFQVKQSFGYLKYKNNFLFVDGKKNIFQCFSNYFDNGNLQEVLKIKTSSFLFEKNIKYDGTSYKNIQNDLCPWVEGVKGDGVGEWIEITFKVWNLTDKNICFLISNGYVDFSKPNLYFNNNRVKEIYVECAEKGIGFKALLEDTPQFQVVKIPKINITENEILTFRFRIESVFKGLKYDDTCINLIVPFHE